MAQVKVETCLCDWLSMNHTLEMKLVFLSEGHGKRVYNSFLLFRTYKYHLSDRGLKAACLVLSYRYRSLSPTYSVDKAYYNLQWSSGENIAYRTTTKRFFLAHNIHDHLVSNRCCVSCTENVALDSWYPLMIVSISASLFHAIHADVCEKELVQNS